MRSEELPRPAVMPVDREAWRKELHLCNFVNSYYQFRDVAKWVGSTPTVLIIGPGQGLDTEILKWRGCAVTTFDIDETFRPDVIGSCHEMPMFRDGQFDVVIASHVLEHLRSTAINDNQRPIGSISAQSRAPAVA
jgi:2-polyprenyl-3-methyl-5-hydroxy-6-metoxy-1,4-benzoquinol methylase